MFLEMDANLRSVLDQPFKVPFVAAIVLVANAENSEVGKAVVEHFSGSLQKNLDHGAFTNVKLLLRFFACLGDMLEDKGAFLVLDHLADKVEACQTTGAEVRHPTFRLWFELIVLGIGRFAHIYHSDYASLRCGCSGSIVGERRIRNA
jgi:hypothetical protein